MSILSFPDRGKWGDRNWRGNCSGHIYKELLTSLKPRVFVDPMVGSGTSIEVAREMGVEAHGLDLHSGFNILRDSILDRVGKPADLVLSHPPYGGMIIYSGDVWGSEAHPDDLSRCENDEDFHQKLHIALLNQRAATAPGGVYGTIIGDWRRNGRYTSYQAECIARMPKELASMQIKAQHNTKSASKTYANMRFPFITHEYIILWQKPRQILSYLGDLAGMAHQQHARLTGTWRAIVHTSLIAVGGEATLADVYQKIEENAPDRLLTNRNWEAKVRQTLNQHPRDFTSDERGIWRLATPRDLERKAA